MSSKLLSVFVVIIVAAVAVAAPGSADAAGPQAPAVVQSYTGCLNPGPNVLVQVALGDIPANPPCRPGASEVHFSGGDLTSLTAGTGLTGGGVNGDVSIALAPSFRLPQTCTTNQSPAWTGTAWGCSLLTPQAVFDSLVVLLQAPGTINQSSNPVHWTKLKGVPVAFADGTDDTGPSYSAGFGLNLIGTTFSVDLAQVQRRVTEDCATGSAIRAVHDDGTVACETVSGGGGSDWSLTGNAGTNSTNFIGTADDQALDLKVNGQRALRLEPRSQSPNVIGGNGDNSAASTVAGATISGGGSSASPNSVSGDFGTVGGGMSNQAGGPFAAIGGGIGNSASSTGAAVLGGEDNEAIGYEASVGGGTSNLAEGERAVVPGGAFNEAIGAFSFAAGFDAHADHLGSFVWGSGDETHSTGPQQFVVRAAGGLHVLDGELFCDGCVTTGDLAPGTTQGLGPYCALVRAHPQSYEGAPCRTVTERVDSVALTTSLAIGIDSNPVVSYSGPGGALKLAHCSDSACHTHDAPSTLAPAGLYTSVAIGMDGHPVVSYQEPGTELAIVHCADATCSAHDPPRTLDSVTGFTSIAIGADGNPVIAYNSSGTELRVVHCTDAACSANDPPGTVASPGVSYPSIAIGGDGNPIISYGGEFGNALRVVHCTDVSCSTHDAPSTLDSNGGQPSIAIGIDGNPVVSYARLNGELRIVHCTNAVCSANDAPRALDSTGYYTSVAIGTDGSPVVSYANGFIFGSLKLVRCTDETCSDHQPPETIDSQGQFTSVAIGTDGNPIIGYEGPSGELRVARPAVN